MIADDDDDDGRKQKKMEDYQQKVCVCRRQTLETNAEASVTELETASLMKESSSVQTELRNSASQPPVSVREPLLIIRS